MSPTSPVHLLSPAQSLNAAHSTLPNRREAAKRRSYLEQHKQRKAATAAREAQEGALIDAWPHGCPAAVLREAHLAGLAPPALHHGMYESYRVSRSPPGSC